MPMCTPPTGPLPPSARNTVLGDSAGPVIQAGTIAGSVTIHTTPAPGPASVDRWLHVGDLHRLWFGVRPTSRFRDEPGLTPYVRRDCDEELRSAVQRGQREGGLVLVTGGPLSGKTMTAACAALFAGTETTPQPRVYAPHPGADLRDIAAEVHRRPDSYILWLDDLEGHLGPHGLTAALLSRLAQAHVLVLATMSDTAYDEHRFGGGPAARVLSGAHTVELSRRWSPAELARLAQADDPRLTDAARWRGGRGITEYLALAPELWDEWRRARRSAAHPRGHLLVRAAIDLGRCGISQAVTSSLLRSVSETYGLRGIETQQETFESALAWATEPRHGGTGLLVPGEEEGKWRAYGSLVADAGRWAEMPPVPDSVWGWALAAAYAEEDYDFVAVDCAFRNALLPRATAGEADAMRMLGERADDTGDVLEAERWYRRAVEAGDAGAVGLLGHLLTGCDALAEAIPFLESAAEAGSIEAAATLGRVHRRLAEYWLRKAAEAGDKAAAYGLAGLLGTTS
ncbi:tetratricopeptide repeat protein [Streptomyces sp. LNU-CPARS28]|uniref:tetratricopeptide repeat protein n=1 Tax=Streptomyces sp. LNU-CPARS28 TaxID=3137371 RepID=UPI00313683A7